MAISITMTACQTGQSGTCTCILIQMSSLWGLMGFVKVMGHAACRQVIMLLVNKRQRLVWNNSRQRIVCIVTEQTAWQTDSLYPWQIVIQLMTSPIYGWYNELSRFDAASKYDKVCVCLNVYMLQIRRWSDTVNVMKNWLYYLSS